jgi:hypothetical protein
LGTGEGGLVESVREYIIPNVVMETSAAIRRPGRRLDGPAGQRPDVVPFTPLLPPRMPPKDEQ